MYSGLSRRTETEGKKKNGVELLHSSWKKKGKDSSYLCGSLSFYRIEILVLNVRHKQQTEL